MILKVLITLIFVRTATLKLTGKVAPDWERWGYPRPCMYATGIAELVALALLWGRGLGAGTRAAGVRRAWSRPARRIGHPGQAPRRRIPCRLHRAHAAARDRAVVPVGRRMTRAGGERT